jgi:hypothetical protein
LVAPITRTSTTDFFFTADALKRALLQDTQHLGLGRQGHVANFIEKK